MRIDRHDEDEMRGAMARAVDVLRGEVAVRPAWRDALLARIEADPLRPSGHGVWRLRPAVAIAAGVMLVILGAAGARLLTGRVAPRGQESDARAELAAVRFVFVAPGAANVSIVGDFNQWNPSSIPLRRLSDGTWITDVPLAPGRYAYAFVVDGKLEPDPSAPRAADGDFGVANSIIMIRGS